jgi:hypothetical protein
MTKSPKLAFGAEVDHVRLAKLLRRAHTIALDTGVAPGVVRQVVSESWNRSVAAGVDPERPAPRMLDAHDTAQHLAAHPMAGVLPKISELLSETLVESGYFAALSNADGVLLWSDGSERALQTAVPPRFLPGFTCSEDRIGTNAIGTALVVDQPVQIFSAEHFNQLLHGWTCAAAPVHDPDSGEVLGAIDLSGEFRTAHVHGLGLVAAVAKAAEGFLAAERLRADASLVRRYHDRYAAKSRRFTGVVSASGRVVHADPPDWLGARVDGTWGAGSWPQRDGTSIVAEPLGEGFVVWREGRAQPRAARVSVKVLGRDQATVVVPGGAQRQLRLRHSEIVALLALHPDGLTVRALAKLLYGSAEREKTVRPEIARLRNLLPGAVLSRPYRLAPHVRVDVARVEAGTTSTYSGPLLPRSIAPGIVAARDRLGDLVKQHPCNVLAPLDRSRPSA